MYVLIPLPQILSKMSGQFGIKWWYGGVGVLFIKMACLRLWTVWFILYCIVSYYVITLAVHTARAANYFLEQMYSPCFTLEKVAYLAAFLWARPSCRFHFKCQTVEEQKDRCSHATLDHIATEETDGHTPSPLAAGHHLQIYMLMT